MSLQTSSPNTDFPTRKLKDSCTNCSLAKVRCGKNKPQCTRCEDRGLACSYGPSQRAGRRGASSLPSFSPNSPVGSNKTSSALTWEDKTMGTKSATESHASGIPLGADASNSTNLASVPQDPTSTIPDFSIEVEMLDSDDMAQLDYSQWNRSDASDKEMAEFSHFEGLDPTSSMAGPFDDINMETLDQWMEGTGSDEWSNFTSISETFGWTETPFLPSAPVTTPAIPKSASPKCTLRMPSSPELQNHSCMQKATQILATIHSDPSTCTEATSSQTTYQNRVAMSINEVIDANKESIKSATTILKCPCSSDEQLLTLLAFIVFKTIERYSAAASESKKTTSSSEQHTVIGKQHLGSSESLRIQAQLILGDLHLVVRLVELLSKRFQEIRAGTTGFVGLDYEDANSKGSWISASVFVQLESHLRLRLSTIIRMTMAILRS